MHVCVHRSIFSTCMFKVFHNTKLGRENKRPTIYPKHSKWLFPNKKMWNIHSFKIKKKILKTFSCHDFPANSGNIKEISSLLQCSFHRRTKGSTREGKQGAHLHVFREVRSSGGQGTWGTLACWRGVKGRTTDWSPREEAVFITGPPSCFKTKTLRLSLDQKDYQ